MCGLPPTQWPRPCLCHYHQWSLLLPYIVIVIRFRRAGALRAQAMRVFCSAERSGETPCPLHWRHGSLPSNSSISQCYTNRTLCTSMTVMILDLKLLYQRCPCLGIATQQAPESASFLDSVRCVRVRDYLLACRQSKLVEVASN